MFLRIVYVVFEKLYAQIANRDDEVFRLNRYRNMALI